MVTSSGWLRQDGVCYYFDENGNPVKNAWKGSYYPKADGKMAVNEWVDGSPYYVGSSGLWKANPKVSNKGSYYSLQGRYDEIVLASKHYPMSKTTIQVKMLLQK